MRYCTVRAPHRPSSRAPPAYTVAPRNTEREWLTGVRKPSETTRNNALDLRGPFSNLVTVVGKCAVYPRLNYMCPSPAT